MLATFPPLTLDQRLISDFPDAFEAYLNDHFAYRSELIRLHNQIRVEGRLVNRLANVIVGKSGWLYFGGNPDILDIRNIWPFDPKQLEQWAKTLTNKKTWLEKKGIEYLFVIPPGKQLVYPEFLPAHLKIFPRESRLDQLVSHLQENTDVTLLDLRTSLISEKQRENPVYEPLYYKTGTHWNDYGAYIGYKALVDQLNNLGLAIKPFRVSDDGFMRIKHPGEDLAGNLELANELSYFKVDFREELATCARYQLIDSDADMALKQVSWFSTTCESRPYRVLMLRDSFSLSMMPYLSETFGYIMYVPHSPAPLNAIKQLVEIHKPDIVIELRSSRWLRTPNGLTP